MLVKDSIPVPSAVALHSFPSKGFSRVWRYSRGQTDALSELISGVDVVHLHGLWMWIQWAAARQATRQSKPFLVTPHGMLEPWIWSRQSRPNQWKKRIYWRGLAYPVFRNAKLVHALTSKEAITLAPYFPGQKIIVVPHGIDLDSIDKTMSILPTRSGDEPQYLLFLGRLHPVKALHLLIRAFARLGKNPFRLKIAGFVEDREMAYALSLHQLVKDLGMEGRVIFTGPAYGAEKWQLYRDAWAFCLPSFSEGLSMVSLEAASARTPVITSFESGMDEDWERNGGMRVHPTEDAIYQGLQQSLGWSENERHDRGKAMRQLVETCYSSRRVGEQWLDAYRELTSGGNRA